MSLDKYDSVYFIGIGGIGMSALARWFHLSGYQVAGYDRTSTPLTEQLISEGLSIHFEDKIELLPSWDINKTLIIYTPAIPKNHKQLNHLRETGYDLKKRSQVLGMISKAYKTVAVAGTHGKTTTSSMVAHILKYAKMDMAAFLGGITANYGSNLIMSRNMTTDTVAVVEADEFDRSFLTLNPNIAVITSADADHLDIYGDAEHLKHSFKEFINKVVDGGTLFINDSVAELAADKKNIEVNTYGIERGQFFASNITVVDGYFVFDYADQHSSIEQIQLGVPGFHNVENATAAIAIALKLGVSHAHVREALSEYKGVKRRFEYILRNEKVVYIDDYAHHPVEVEAFIRSLRKLYPTKRLTVIFQPHLYSRTRDFAAGFARSLSLADEVILLDIYPAREEPIAGVSSQIILKDVTVEKMACAKEDLMSLIKERDVEVLATVGAGDIDQFIKPISELLNEKYAL